MQEMLAAQDLKHTPEGDRAVASSVVEQRDVYKMIDVGSPVLSVAVSPGEPWSRRVRRMVPYGCGTPTPANR
jgi:hypothetical protein